MRYDEKIKLVILVVVTCHSIFSLRSFIRNFVVKFIQRNRNLRHIDCFISEKGGSGECRGWEGEGRGNERDERGMKEYKIFRIVDKRNSLKCVNRFSGRPFISYRIFRRVRFVNSSKL